MSIPKDLLSNPLFIGWIVFMCLVVMLFFVEAITIIITSLKAVKHTNEETEILKLQKEVLQLKAELSFAGKKKPTKNSSK